MVLQCRPPRIAESRAPRPAPPGQGRTAVLDAPLQLAVWAVAAFVFRRRGDRWWVAIAKGLLVMAAFTTVLGLLLWVAS